MPGNRYTIKFGWKMHDFYNIYIAREISRVLAADRCDTVNKRLNECSLSLLSVILICNKSSIKS